MSTQLAAIRALTRAHRELKRAQELLEDETVRIFATELTDAMHQLSELYKDRCFALALEHGAPLVEITSAVTNASAGGTHIASARLLEHHVRHASYVWEERQKAREFVQFAASRLSRMLLLIQGKV